MSAAFSPNLRLPDPRVQVLDDSFLALRLMSGTVEQRATGFYWAEGPVWFGDGRFLLFSDIQNNRILRWDDCSGALSEFRKPSHHANGLARDRQGPLLACEHGTRRVTRTGYDGRLTVLASHFEGKPLNSPNDIVCRSDGSIWFTDPPFGIQGWWEGALATPELPHGVYRIDPHTGVLAMVLHDLQGSNGVAFTPGEQSLYVAESRALPHRKIWLYDVQGTRLVNKRLFVDAGGPGAFDGIAVDVQGNVWCGLGSTGAVGADAAEWDGARVYSPEGRPLGHIQLPERCAKLCFGGPRNNRWFMANSHALHALHALPALHVNTRGAVWGRCGGRFTAPSRHQKIDGRCWAPAARGFAGRAPVRENARPRPACHSRSGTRPLPSQRQAATRQPCRVASCAGFWPCGSSAPPRCD